MRSTCRILAAALALVVLGISPAHAAPAHPDRWVVHEAGLMDCRIDGPAHMAGGPPNRGVTCHVGSQGYRVLYYRRMGDALRWWEARLREAWIVRDGLVLIIPDGVRRDDARTAARDVRGRVLPVWVSHGIA